MLFLTLEVMCVLLIAVGLALWFTLGTGMVAAGGLGLVLVVAAQVPDGEGEV